MKQKLQLAVLTVAFALCSCAINRPSIVTEEHGTNGVVTIRRTHSLTMALWPATSEIAKQKLGNAKGHSIGTYDLEQKSDTNLLAALEVLKAIVSKIP
jgi:hypothetical protein